MRAVNLLPDAKRTGQGQGQGVPGGAYAVLGVLAVLLVMALAYTLTANQANSRTSEAAKAKQDADAAEARAKALGAFDNFAAIKQARTASVKQLAGGRFDWERMLRELSAVLPRGGWVQEAKASVTGNTDGQAPEPGAAAKPALQLTGCLRQQSDVAAFMVRLRKLYLVEDVELKESVTTAGAAEAAEAAGEKERSDSADPNDSKPTIDNCGRLFKFDITVRFEAAAPTGREAPRGSKAVPARLGGGS